MYHNNTDLLLLFKLSHSNAGQILPITLTDQEKTEKKTVMTYLRTLLAMPPPNTKNYSNSCVLTKLLQMDLGKRQYCQPIFFFKNTSFFGHHVTEKTEW